MPRLRTTIENRLFDAVLMVLAGAGCQPAPTGARTAPPPPPDELVTETTVVNDQPIETSPADASNAQTAQTEPGGLCAAYKQRSRVDASKAKPARAPQWQTIDEGARWNPTRSVAHCTIIRDRVETTISTTYTPPCCQGGGPQRCAGPQKVEVPGEKLLVEIVELAPDGSILTSATQWRTVGEPRRPHNCGRRPEGMRIVGRGDAIDHDDIGCQLSEMAELEAASVPAFERLARELAFHGAPDRLVRQARAAMRDEVRHARVMRGLATRYGQVPREIEVPPLPVRSLPAIARENAIEGCVREAYGALVATYQAECAAPELRAAFRAIAADERRHAALAEDVHAWITGALDGAAQAELAGARLGAKRDLRTQLAASPPSATLGVPGGAPAVELFDAYFA